MISYTHDHIAYLITHAGKIQVSHVVIWVIHINRRYNHAKAKDSHVLNCGRAILSPCTVVSGSLWMCCSERWTPEWRCINTINCYYSIKSPVSGTGSIQQSISASCFLWKNRQLNIYCSLGVPDLHYSLGVPDPLLCMKLISAHACKQKVWAWHKDFPSTTSGTPLTLTNIFWKIYGYIMNSLVTVIALHWQCLQIYYNLRTDNERQVVLRMFLINCSIATQM